jgi:transcription-repair coupling factor (superfamily II helicase)
VATRTTHREGLEELLAEAAGALAPSLRGDHVVASAPAAGHPFVAAAVAALADAPVLAVAPDPRSAQALADASAAWLGEHRVVLFPAWESLPYEGISPGPLTAGRRAAAAARLHTSTGPLVVAAPVLAVLQRIAPDLGAHAPLEIVKGGELPFDDLLESLTSLGYSRVDVVEHRGEFAVRGGILDVFPATARRPARAEFFGDEIESLREFSTGTQLSTGQLDRVQVHPCRELVVDREARTRAEQALNRSTIRGQYRSILERLADGLTFEGMEQAIPLLHDRLPFIADLLPPASPVVLTHARLTVDRAAKVVTEADALAEASEWPGARVIEEPDVAFGGRDRVDVSELSEGTDLGLRPWEPGGEAGAVLAGEASRLHRAGTRIVVAAEGRGSLDRALEVLESAGLPPGEVVGVRADVEEGFSFERGRVALLTEEDLFGRRRHTREAPRLTQRRAESVAAELEPGDLCVHQVHGVGRYVGMVRRAVAGSERDYLLLEYAQGDRLYVPSDQVGVVTKYVGGEAPRVHRLGSSDWVRAKGRVRRAIRDMAGELVRLYSVRMSVKGHAFAPDTPWQMELEDAFPHEETRDQLAAIAEVKQDMQSDRPMDRLICGDVGYGKTEIAVRAAFKAVMDGKQVAVLVPTTLLAEQHHVTFSERFAPFPVKVAMLSRFLSTQEQEQVVERVKAGEVDVVIGTHRLLSSDIRFKDLGLLIVDEEQRFGVTHKERLKKLRTSVDVLTMTATPIPRTLEMALAGIRDMSSVDTPPEDRQPVLTYVGSYEEDMALAAVRRELLRGGQVFWVHNRVETIGRAAGKLQGKLPDARVATAHGQMDERTLEKVMMAFWDRTADVLVCTTIIESGLDVPSANTLVVERADRLGLAQMYQLRGRVGRSAERAFAYLFFPPQAKLTEDAHARLAAISRHTALGSGFQIAMKDLEIRGAGNLLGAEQHGHIAAVGFDTYVRLLAESVAEMKGEPVVEEREVRVDLPVRAFIPPEWLGQEALRLELYRRISMASDHDELARVRAEAEDRFGRIPDEVRTLFAIQSLRLACLAAGVEEISTIKMQIRIKPVPPELGHTLALDREDAVYHEVTRTLNLQPPNQFREDLLVGYVEDAVGGSEGEGAKEGA